MLLDVAAMSSLIIRHTLPTTRHLTPSIALRLITPECPLWKAKEDDVPFKDPFWAFYWPGGQAAARYILENAELVRNRRIIDIGSNDIDPYAVVASKLNADLNSVPIDTSTEDFIGQKLEDFDTVLIGDMFYDEDFAKYLFEWLRNLAADGKTVLIGDPGRHGLTANRVQHITQLAKYKLPEDSCMENHGFTDTTLWRLNK
ncbi:electron transfer flavoprotein beta subunit lysine methyltransferase [Phthorimaea operculella]|nr:electron transfer flavoprotein beta subunit lysine methyltransferase [Phthorimaea operculella]